MEFYSWRAAQRIDHELVSIPNGMEFYTLAKTASLAVPMFQFPTGWNSTKELLKFGVKIDVSIPNGMEFYLNSTILSERSKCFNSQRDGILQLSFQRRVYWKGWVSIPNGMEFYKASSYLSYRRRSKFQFPTGWNSTYHRFSDSLHNKRFQFPTGWNSTIRP